MHIKKERLIKLMIIGVIGAICNMIGDCLLLGADSAGAADTFDKIIIIASKISYTRIGLAGFFGYIGIPVTAIGCSALYFMMNDRSCKLAKIYLFSMIASYMALGGAIHIICCYMITGIKKNIEIGAEDILMTTLNEQLGYIIPCFAVFFILYSITAITMMIIIAKGKTVLPKWMWILNPMLFKGLINAFGELGNSAFINGIQCSNMSLGSIIILCVWIGAVRKSKDLSE